MNSRRAVRTAAALAVLGVGLAAAWWALRAAGHPFVDLVPIEDITGPMVLLAMAGWTRLHGALRSSAPADGEGGPRPEPVAAPGTAAAADAVAVFSASIAHEVGQPLAAIVTASEAGYRWLDREAPDIAQAKAAIARVRDDALRAHAIVQSLRTLTALHPPQLQAVSLHRLLQEAVGAAQPLLEPAQVHVEIAPDPGLVARIDRALVQQVLRNLISNAVDAMGAVPAATRVLRLDGGECEGMLLLNVHDTGQGLPAGPSAQVFEPFFTTKAHGMGIGLHLCQRIVHAHGGRLWCAARAGGGTTFSFSMPRCTDQGAQAAQAAQA